MTESWLGEHKIILSNLIDGEKSDHTSMKKTQLDHIIISYDVNFSTFYVNFLCQLFMWLFMWLFISTFQSFVILKLQAR